MDFFGLYGQEWCPTYVVQDWSVREENHLKTCIPCRHVVVLLYLEKYLPDDQTEGWQWVDKPTSQDWKDHTDAMRQETYLDKKKKCLAALKTLTGRAWSGSNYFSSLKLPGKWYDYPHQDECIEKARQRKVWIKKLLQTAPEPWRDCLRRREEALAYQEREKPKKPKSGFLLSGGNKQRWDKLPQYVRDDYNELAEVQMEEYREEMEHYRLVARVTYRDLA